MKKMIVLAAAVLTSSAFAQMNAQKPWGLSIGGHFPTSGTVRNGVDDLLYRVGVTYDWKQMMQGEHPFTTSFYVDYAFLERSGNHLNTWGFGIQARSYAGNQGAGGGRVYYGAGIGAYWADYQIGLLNASDFRLGGKVFLGWETQQFFLQGGYDMIGSRNGVNPSGWNINIGMRF